MLMVKKLHNYNLDIWGGIECTINRVKNNYFDQLEYSGHYNREDDLDAIAALGIKMLRYPILWEYHNTGNKGIDWTWSTKQLTKIRSLGITPIAGLVHHGSGPMYTNLNKDSFATGLAEYAGKVALQFPWIEYYTPVNEPLTTARFSGLYGFWYPHLQNDISFARMLLNQLKGTVLAMAEIRKVNPNAKLVQTEDLGKTYSTPILKYQADFENQRRWLTFDLLCSKVTPGHPMWAYFVRLGIPESSLQFFLDNPCPPDIIGANYYVTSERYLDDDISRYPSNTHGGNELQTYADLEAVRARHNQKTGLDELLKEAWSRYQLPLAITEVHLNCTREEQLRWFKETWETCKQLCDQDIDIRGITAWSLFGAYGWNQLLTTRKMDYEPGVFDVRSGKVRPTALAKLIQNLIEHKKYEHPVLEEAGWWKRDIRYLDLVPTHLPSYKGLPETSPVLIIGKNGTLGQAFMKVCNHRAIKYKMISREECDITVFGEIEKIINKYKPWAIINAAGFVRVDAAETAVDKCFAENITGPANLAQSCNKFGIKLLSFSSDMVFDGSKDKPYLESDVVNPLNTYGRSKAESEISIFNYHKDSLVIRSSSFFGPWDQHNFVIKVINALGSNQPFYAVNDVFISPTYIPDFVNTALDLLIDDEKGTWHVVNNGFVNWAEFAFMVAERAGLDSSLIIECSVNSMDWNALRPLYSVLQSEKGISLPGLDNALNRYFSDRKNLPVYVPAG